MSTVNQRQEVPGPDNPFDIKENNDVRFMSVDRELVDAFGKVYIFSVDPNPHRVSKGGRGEFVIPGRTEGERVSEPLVIQGRHPEHMQVGGTVSPIHYEDGMLFAKDIVGVDSADRGLGRHTTDLQWHGVFITRNKKPTKEEITAAESKRQQFLERVVADGDRKFMRGERPDAFEVAACHELKLKKSWAESPKAMEQCEACGTSIIPGVAVCPSCKAILNEEKARKFFPERFQKSEPINA